MKVGEYSCARCGRKGTLLQKGQTVFQCSYCGAPYIIEGIPTQTQTKTQPRKTLTQSEKAKLEAAQKRFDKLKDKKITEPKKVSAELKQRLRDVLDLANWAGIPMPKSCETSANVEKMFEKCSLHGLRLVDNETGKTMFDFGQAKEHGLNMLWGIDEKQFTTFRS